MSFILFDSDSLLGLSKEELEYIPKVVLLKYYSRDIHYVWDKLPSHIKVDPEVQSYRRCLVHYNRPDQRSHIDGPPPMIRNCYICMRGQDQDL